MPGIYVGADKVNGSGRLNCYTLTGDDYKIHTFNIGADKM